MLTLSFTGQQEGFQQPAVELLGFLLLFSGVVALVFVTAMSSSAETAGLVVGWVLYISGSDISSQTSTTSLCGRPAQRGIARLVHSH